MPEGNIGSNNINNNTQVGNINNNQTANSNSNNNTQVSNINNSQTASQDNSNLDDNNQTANQVDSNSNEEMDSDFLDDYSSDNSDEAQPTAEDQQKTKKQKEEEAGAKGAKVAAKAAANYFAPGVGGQVVDAVANTEAGQKILNTAGKALNRNPITKKVLTKANEDGTLDMADKATDMIGGSPSAAGASGSAGATGASAAPGATGSSATPGGSTSTGNPSSPTNASKPTDNPLNKTGGLEQKNNSDSSGNKKSESGSAMGELFGNTGSFKQKMIQFIIANPWIIPIAAIVLLLLMILLGNDGITGGDDGGIGYYDPACNFNNTSVTIMGCDSGEDLQTLSLNDYVVKMAYLYTKDGNYSDETFKALMIILKTNVLSIGGYNSSSKKVSVRICDVYDGIVNESSLFEGVDDKLDDLIDLYDSISEYLFISSSYNSNITFLGNDDIINFNSTILSNFEAEANKGKDYEEILDTLNTSSNLKLYKLGDYCTYYNITENDAYWWPIGSSTPSNGNIYGGTPVDSTITSHFGPRIDPITGVADPGHGAIDIAVPRNTPIIATKDGTVVIANTGCTEGNLSCGGGYGNYVKIDHGEGVESLYAHLTSLEVENGDIVKQGQLIAYSGSTGRSTGPHLHFEIRLNGTKVDPEDYVSMSNPRPINSINPNVTGEAGDYKNMLCSSLLASGFSKEATIGIMSNIYAESGYIPINLQNSYEIELGFNDSSYTLAVDDGSYTNFANDSAGYGLVQWTSSGRKKGLYDYAKSRNTSIGDFDMQFNYMLQELENYYPSIYKYITGNYTAIKIGAYWCDHYEVPAGSEPCSVQGSCPSQFCVNRTTNSINSEALTEYVNNGCK